MGPGGCGPHTPPRASALPGGRRELERLPGLVESRTPARPPSRFGAPPCPRAPVVGLRDAHCPQSLPTAATQFPRPRGRADPPPLHPGRRASSVPPRPGTLKTEAPPPSLTPLAGPSGHSSQSMPALQPLLLGRGLRYPSSRPLGPCLAVPSASSMGKLGAGRGGDLGERPRGGT